MGCVVNGPGRASTRTSVSRFLDGRGPKAPVYVDGKLKTTLKGETIAEDFARILDDYVARRFAGPRLTPIT
jgi:(E)-4-hydroxy-3-methylbut-2-enyl-diphosphate synthase